MVAAPNQVFFPSNFQELFAIWNRFPDAVPYAGGTSLIRDQEKRLPSLPGNIISLDKMADLRRITRTERYLEVGAMVCLSEIVNLGKIVPEILVKTLEGIAGLHIRNIATIGGNLCDKTRRLDASAPLAALDAVFELRNSAAARWISAARFFTPFPPMVAPQELLTRIRIPLEQWNFSRYRKFTMPGSDDSGNVIVFIMKNQKDILTDLHVVFSGARFLQNRQAAVPLAGKRLPLQQREAQAFCNDWEKFLHNPDLPKAADADNDEFYNVQILNFIEDAIFEFAD